MRRTIVAVAAVILLAALFVLWDDNQGVGVDANIYD